MLNKKLAEWAGFKRVQSSYTEDPQRIIWDGWTLPDNSGIGSLPDFPNDLNACFEWLVPKLKEVDICKREGVFYTEATLEITNDGDYYDKFEAGVDKNPALALCKAIEKVIDKEER